MVKVDIWPFSQGWYLTFQPRLIFDLSAKVAPSVGLLSSYSHIFFSETPGQIEVKFHMEHPLDTTTLTWLNDPGRMTRMAVMYMLSENS